MILNRKQEEGLKIAVKRYQDHEKCTVIAGYAGTGKSTLVRFIIEALGIEESSVCFATFTGKAAQVLQKKGNKNVRTLHKLLYEHYPKPDGTFYRRKVPVIPYSLVVVDEVSMAPKELMDLLFTHPCHVICLGDPFQLPPVDKDEDNHLLDHPHIFLDEIMRQEAESEIIRLSMDIREGNSINYGKGKDVIILPKNQLSTGMLTWADQIICSVNKTRISLNNQMRALLGREGEPEDGDKVICLRNYWDNFDDDNNPLVNGTIGYLQQPYEQSFWLPGYMTTDRKSIHYDAIYSGFLTDSNSLHQSLLMDKKMILEGEATLPWKITWKMKKSKYASFVPMEFTYGYAITGHKSQGSEFDKVLAIEEGFPKDRTEHARWLYTVVTRASEKLVLVR